MKRREALEQLARLDILRRAIPEDDRAGQHLLERQAVRAWQALWWAECARDSTPTERAYTKRERP